MSLLRFGLPAMLLVPAVSCRPTQAQNVAPRAQTPNLAGTWTRIVDSNASAAGGSNAGAPDLLTIVQDAKTMTMDAQTAQGNETTFTFSFDGTDSKKTMTDGSGSFDLVTRAKWDGSTLRATVTRDLGARSIILTFAISLDISGRLVVSVSRTPPGGSAPVTTTSSYKKLALSLASPVAGHAQDLPWMHPKLTPAQRTARLLGAMTTAEKFEQLIGAPGIVPELPQCFGTRHVPGIPRLRIPTLRITNGPVGIGGSDCRSQPATALPSGMAVGASFDPAVATQFGDVIGLEAHALALHVVEGPGLNLTRVPQGGRNFEYFGEDPFLTGMMGVAEIRAIQRHGVIAMAKHFVANDQETNRLTVNETIADRVLHELYLLPFEMAVKDGKVAAVMCSYNAVNGPHACEDRHHLTDVLRGQWGFSGYVQSDFWAVHSTAPTLLAGMDHEMPGSRGGNPPGPWFTPEKLQAALDAHEITAANIDTALARRYRQMFRLGIFDRPIVPTPIDTTRDGATARSIGEAAAVLLKNREHVLPLDAKALRSVALIGKAEYATKAVAGCCGGSSDVLPLYTVTPLEGVKRVLASLGSTATVTLTVVAKDNGNLADAVASARSAEVVVVLAGTLSDEGRDRPHITLTDEQDAMISAVAAANPRTVVVLKDNASVLLPWIDQVPAVLETWFPGEEDGDIMSRLLFGVVTPSGKLPVTFPRSATDLPASTPRQWPGVSAQGNPVPVGRNDNAATSVEYSEGLQIGYRWYDARAIAPLFPFGYGLSYTTFRLSQIDVKPRASDGKHPIVVRVTVENTGRRRGAEVPQVYLGLPDSTGEPPKRLIAFDKVWLDPETKRVIRLVIDPAASNNPLSYWDTKEQKWVTASGVYRVSVGTSSADIVLKDSVRVTPSRTP
jgi:beta-glucosidase